MFTIELGPYQDNQDRDRDYWWVDGGDVLRPRHVGTSHPEGPRVGFLPRGSQIRSRSLSPSTRWSRSVLVLLPPQVPWSEWGPKEVPRDPGVLKSLSRKDLYIKERLTQPSRVSCLLRTTRGTDNTRFDSWVGDPDRYRVSRSLSRRVHESDKTVKRPSVGYRVGWVSLVYRRSSKSPPYLLHLSRGRPVDLWTIVDTLEPVQ